MTKDEMTPQRLAQAELAQVEIVELIDQLVREGMDWRAVLTGMMTATASLLITRVGPSEVPVWFARASAQTMHLAKTDS